MKEFMHKIINFKRTGIIVVVAVPVSLLVVLHTSNMGTVKPYCYILFPVHILQVLCSISKYNTSIQVTEPVYSIGKCSNRFYEPMQCLRHMRQNISILSSMPLVRCVCRF